MKWRRTTSAVLAVFLSASALASPIGSETWANEAWRWLGSATVGDSEANVDEDFRELTIDEWIELIDEVDKFPADTGIRNKLDVDISRSSKFSEPLAEFFRDATVESVKPFLDSEQLLQQAARYADDPGIITFLIAHGFDPNKAFGPTIPAANQYYFRAGEQRAGPLHDAARFNANPSIVEALVKGGADVQATGGWDMYTPLHYAARYNNAAVVSALIRGGARPNEAHGPIDGSYAMGPNINGNTALHVAAWADNTPAIDALVAAGANVHQVNSSGFTPLHAAVLRLASLSTLLGHGADANAVVKLVEEEAEMHDCTGCNPIHLLVDSLRRDSLDLEKMRSLLTVLLDAGADINAKIAQHMYGGYSALGLAVASELGSEAVALLLELGAKVDPGSLRAVFEETYQYTGRYAGGYDRRNAGAEDNLRILRLLIGNGADVNVADSLCQRTALHLAASVADDEELPIGGRSNGPGLARAVKSLIRAGADVNARTVAADRVRGNDGIYYECPHRGATPLHIAASGGATPVASALIDNRADVQAKDADGRTPTDIAAARGHVDILNLFLRNAAWYPSPEVVALLIERGAEAGARDDIGWTPLHYALLWRAPAWKSPVFQTANVLLEHGADVNAATPAMGWTPLHLAAYLDGEDALEIVQTLIERGANVNARTRIGGWSPARVARENGEHNDADASPQAVLSAIQAAGGKDEGCDDAPMLPEYHYGSRLDDQTRYWSQECLCWLIRKPQPVVAVGCEYNIPFSVPTAIIGVDGWNVAGSFTAPGADEALQFVGVGPRNDGSWYNVLSLRDQRGAFLPVMTFGHYTDYEGLCLDPETNTHAAVFTQSTGGSCCPWTETVYYHYNADMGNLVEVFTDITITQPTGPKATCLWRDKKNERASTRPDCHRLCPAPATPPGVPLPQ